MVGSKNVRIREREGDGGMKLKENIVTDREESQAGQPLVDSSWRCPSSCPLPPSLSPAPEPAHLSSGGRLGRTKNHFPFYPSLPPPPLPPLRTDKR